MTQNPDFLFVKNRSHMESGKQDSLFLCFFYVVISLLAEDNF